MSVKNRKKEQQSSKLTPINPGEILCRARKEKGLAVEEVTLHLGITKRVLNALEHDEYDCLPSPMYVKGYIRRYCSILGISEGELLVGFDARMIELGLGQREPSIRLEGTQKKKQVWPLVIPVILIVLAVIIFWLFLSSRDNDSTNLELMDTAPLTSSTTKQVKHQMSPAYVPVAMNEAPREQLPMPGNQILLIHVVQQSWIEILDAQGDILLADLKAPGYQGEVSGLAPFEITLGNAPGVELSLNGERVSVPSTGNDNMAKFKIGDTKEG